MLISKHKRAGLKHYNDYKAFIAYSNDMDDIYENIEEYNLNKKRKMLAVFDEMIADMLSNIKIQQIAAELFIRGTKLKDFIILLHQKTD